jgi:hypothetical protein
MIDHDGNDATPPSGCGAVVAHDVGHVKIMKASSPTVNTIGALRDYFGVNFDETMVKSSS